ncbi:hypothetical protein HJ526_06625 [Donghicola sp. C2-DW-16]|uniref:Co-chaperone DjlA N-terminal domain-containing protein n=1 Tax=Donghicola mangrovi TaxID=2729614 RepID=A0A850Q912_9RHOB|nr:TerB family tellurite resistance protein [Donghicola mangrovi]NVO23458.1 hypothetical protein [Donghicola mangrovi]NVO27084.1 hypothetical protein [Donghicola mangrovi]
MFESLKSLFAAPAPVFEEPEIDSRVAVAALLVHAAKTAGPVTYEEIRSIDRSLARHFGLNVLEAMKLRADGERLDRARADTGSIIASIRRALNPEERFGVLSSLWEVILLSGINSPHKDALLYATRTGFQIPGDEAHIAREHAQLAM